MSPQHHIKGAGATAFGVGLGKSSHKLAQG
jgi:hypothetical protein